MDQDLKLIKKKYGENMAKLCREFFSTLLEEDGLLPTLMLKTFEPNHSLYNDLIDQKLEDKFKNYIYSLVDVENNNEIKTTKTPKELLSEAGYDLYECKTEEEIQQFRKYYAKNEELCTFNGGRLDKCRVFFAVKKDVDEINRVNYENPQRQDEYGTSVISIQFTKDPSHTLSIKNRYNHRVNNPDSTFSNNLDNIIEGLTESFENEYGLIQQHKNNNFEIENYVKASDGKYYKYNHEVNNIYYCPNNIIIDDFKVKRYEKEKYILMAYFVLDLVNKKIKLYDEKIKDAFLDTIGDIKKIEIEKNKKEKRLLIKINNGEDIKIVLNEDNKMIKLFNPNVEKVKDQFLFINTALQELTLPNLKEVGDDFLYYNNAIQKLDLPNLRIVENSFLSGAETLQVLNLPNLQIVGHEFLCYNKFLQEINLPNLCEVGNYFLNNNKCINELNLPNLQKIGSYFLGMNTSIEKLKLPKVQEVGDDFLLYNKLLQKLTLSNLQKTGEGFLYFNNSLQELNLPNLQEVEYAFLYENNSLQKLTLPNLTKIGDYFLNFNNSLQKLILPKVQEIGDFCLYTNKSLQEVNMPSLQKVGTNFLYYNEILKKINCPNLDEIGYNFLYYHPIFDDTNFKDNDMSKVKQKSI